jgi:hypothetical protein
MMPLTAPTRRFPALAPLNQNHRRDNHNRSNYKTEWLQSKPQPMKHEDVAEPHGNGRQNDDEERAIHGKNVQYGCEH